MLTKTLAKGVLGALLMMTVSATALGHEGHQRHLMGTVTAVDASRLELTTTEGKAAAVALTPETKVFKGKTLAKVADIKKGDRVMVEADDASDSPKAITIYLGTDAK